MLTIAELQGKKVFVPKKARGKAAKNPNPVEEGLRPGERLAKLGKIHMTVFAPDGRSVVGFLVRRPDVVGVVKRDDVFLAFDSLAPCERGFRVTRGEDAFDAAARERLGISQAWDTCIMWAGMDAVTKGGRELGYVGDTRFDEKTGKVDAFLIGDGGLANALVGSLEIPPSMLVGYSKGRMVVSDEAASLGLNGGLAAKAGEAAAKAKVKGAEFGKKAGAATSEAVDKGSFALGKAIGGAKRAIREASEEAKAEEAEERAARQPQMPPQEAEGVRVSDPVRELPKRGESGQAAEKKTYVPKSAVPGGAEARRAAASPKKPAGKKPAAQKRGTAKKKADDDLGKQASRALGMGLGRMGKAFSGFKDEFDKNSR